MDVRLNELSGRPVRLRSERALQVPRQESLTATLSAPTRLGPNLRPACLTRHGAGIVVEGLRRSGFLVFWPNSPWVFRPVEAERS